MLAQGTKDHIPFRNSPLTKILKTSLGGNSRTAIILCITPSMRQVEQTTSTLRFGQNAKKVTNKVRANFKMATTMNQREVQLEAMLSQYEERIANIQQVNNNGYGRLKEMIDQLQKEKDGLKTRLLKANVERLDGNGEGDNEREESDDEACREILLKNCGLVCSSTRL